MHVEVRHESGHCPILHKTVSIMVFYDRDDIRNYKWRKLYFKCDLKEPCNCNLLDCPIFCEDK